LIPPVLCALLISGAAAAAPAEARDRPSIEAFEAERAEGRVAVSWTVAVGLTDDALERIHSGIPVTLRHRVELVVRRAVPLWRARILSRAVIEVTARFDALTRQYDLERRTRFDDSPDGPTSSLDVHRTDSEAEMLAWMTRVEHLPRLTVPDDVPPGRLRVRVESWLGRRYVWYMLPWSITASAESRVGPE